MAMVLTCDECGLPIDRSAPFGDDSWVNVVVAIDEPAKEIGHPKDYHRRCARTVTIADAWARPGLVAL